MQPSPERPSAEFHLGMALAGGLMIIGGVIAGIGLRNPERREAREAPRAATAGDCGHCPPGEEPGDGHATRAGRGACGETA